MKKTNMVLTVILIYLILPLPLESCTSLIVTKGASEDGSVMITYTCDGEFHPHLEMELPADHAPGDSVDIINWRDNRVIGRVQQVPHTYGVVHLMNEHQVVIGETTFDGREELRNEDGLLGYWDLMYFALQRAATAREAITVMTELAEEYGYRSTGESFSIGDPDEAWIMEMIGPGKGGHGTLWVALRVPDGYVCCHANQARIGEFPLDDPENCRYAENVINFAVEKGYYDPASGEPFRFRDAYCPATVEMRHACAGRVWSIFRRVAPSQNFSDAYQRGDDNARPYPLWVKPDQKVSFRDVTGLMRDHYEGTPYDMTQGIDAGPFGCPYRWRPLQWDIDSTRYAWERAVSTQQTGYSFISQSRAGLPDPVGGVIWYGVDDTWFTCWFPLYCGIEDLPVSFTRGSMQEFSWESAWWVFNFVSNYSCLKYSYMIKDVQKVQSELEEGFIVMQPAVEKTALQLFDKNPALARNYLTNYSVSTGEQVVRRWRELAEQLLVKYNDGYIKNDKGAPESVGYPEAWLREVLKTKADTYRVGRAKSDEQ
ncbi:MAG: dipeptidase [Candidatus Zixiibacteriota bacterium]